MASPLRPIAAAAAGLLAVAAIGCDARAAKAPAGTPAAPILSCRLANGRSATVTRSGGTFTYRFGRPDAPDITLVGDPTTRTVFGHTASFPRAGWSQLRFANGSTSYLLFHYLNLGNYVRNYDGAAEERGLIVYRNGRRVAAHLCTDADGLGDGSVIASLPDDPEDHSSDIIDDVERRR